jgi:hypothetical protein
MSPSGTFLGVIRLRGALLDDPRSVEELRERPGELGLGLLPPQPPLGVHLPQPKLRDPLGGLRGRRIPLAEVQAEPPALAVKHLGPRRREAPEQLGERERAVAVGVDGPEEGLHAAAARAVRPPDPAGQLEERGEVII